MCIAESALTNRPDSYEDETPSEYYSDFKYKRKLELKMPRKRTGRRKSSTGKKK